jgi:hypothetical protein
MRQVEGEWVAVRLLRVAYRSTSSCPCYNSTYGLERLAVAE